MSLVWGSFNFTRFALNFVDTNFHDTVPLLERIRSYSEQRK